ncbi:serine hydrolase domain-containing protein [Sungkyunkwania multivorans]|uniref:Serine hydrolase domain-containing protein n=1 Tax=Sungkyunkwania multivorans TaxID=1173618 RepID=A0ABW3D2W8_9FLAO
MRKLKFVFLALLLFLIVLVYFNYPKLNIVSGYSAKMMSSSVFVADRGFEYTDTHDNNFDLVAHADDEVFLSEGYATASVFGLMERKAVYREGLGSVLVNDEYDAATAYLKPNRQRLLSDLPFPYGDLPQKDTVFPEIDYKTLVAAVDSAFSNNKIRKTRAVLVIYKDHIIAEKYEEGFDKNSRFLGWSMTKSITSTMFGVLAKQGKIQLDQAAPIIEWQDDERKDITIQHLLQMNSGLEWNEDYGSISDVTEMLFLDSDMTKKQAAKELVYKPGSHWNYSSGTSNLLSGIVRKQFDTHQEYLDFPYKAFIDRIGMHSMLLEADMEGNYVGSSYSWATTRDWAKFGLLYLHRGNWNGERIFNEDWVDFVSTPAPNSGGQYGGHFWLNRGPDNYMPDVPEDAFMANGFQGQRVTIIPSKDMVIVRLGLAEWPDFDFNMFLGGVVKAVQ